MINPFTSFFIGGFECADHINRSGERVNLLKETEHHLRVEEDYKLLKEMGITSVREGICWSVVENKKNCFDFSEVLNRMQIAEKMGIQQIWDLIHFGYPDDLFPTHPQFVQRFINLCTAFVKFYKKHTKRQLLVVPSNEISFLSWFSGEARGTVPFAHQNGWDIKYHLCKAVIAGIKALKAEDPTCTIIMVEPLVRIHPDGERTAEELFRVNEYQFEAMDMIAGRLCPELGGQESFLEILGFNYYWNCQWKKEGETVYWPDPEQKRVPLRTLLQEVYARYKKPIFLSETGHFGEGRIPWLEETTAECLAVMEKGIPFFGACIYPVTDRPNWDNLASYSQCGIFDLDSMGNRLSVDHLQECIMKLDRKVSLFTSKARMATALI